MAETKCGKEEDSGGEEFLPPEPQGN